MKEIKDEALNYEELTTQDEALTYEELTARCRKQEEYIKKLENKIYGTLSDEKCMPSLPTYEELESQLERQSDALRKSDEMLSAIMEALRISNNRLRDETERADYYKERYDKTKKCEGS